jgi:hypothetical protein
MPTTLFVHGTGVREEGYIRSFEVIKSAFHAHKIPSSVEACLWGNDLGSRLPRLSLPKPIVHQETRAKPQADVEIARWRLLYDDPLFELRLLKNRPSPKSVILPGAPHPGRALWARIEPYCPSPAVANFLAQYRLAAVWDKAWSSIITPKGAAADVAGAATTEIGEPAQAIARAVVAQVLVESMQEGEPLLNSAPRDRLVELLLADWQANVAGVGTFLLGFFSELPKAVGTLAIKWKRGDFTELASPAVGDILLYQVRGDAIRSFIRDSVLRCEDDVFLLGHSLGGIACVDLLVKNKLDQVKGLITVGSQAPLLGEIGALWSREERIEPLPAHFPRWLNIYDQTDFLSYLAGPVFQSGKEILDKDVSSGQPFPESHSSYWTNHQTYEAIAEFMG